MRPLIHYFLHFGVPLFIALYFYKKKWKQVYLIFLASMLIDLDHLLANPIFDPNRCSVGFHPLHSYFAVIIYIIGLVPTKTRVLALALLFHILTDYIDCLLM
ncbi:DUF6122 family protein [Pseudofulvibacter geojedonensis]|uniref:DUF6122 family protein n=1 Tax=Pseudofulvibacter geojedonensis TaxID=1123758 RepID=A0ABW3I2E0_9FLAO